MSFTSFARLATTAVVAGLVPLAVPPLAAEAAGSPEWRQEAEAFTTKTTGAQFSDANASGGAAWHLWTTGSMSTTFTATSTSAKQLDVVARGEAAAGVWPVMRVYVDGTQIAEETVASLGFRTYSATVSVTSGSHTLKVEFGNDAIVNGEDRNLVVDAASVTPSGAEEWRQEVEAFTTRPTGQQIADTNASSGQYWALWSNGHVETTLTAAGSGTKNITVSARGNVAGGGWPNMRVSLDGVVLSNHTVATTTWQTFTTVATVAKGTHTLRMEFTNDAVVGTEDRNLKVDLATLLPAAHEWRQEAESFTTKTAGAATSSSLASGGTFWNLWSDGHLSTSFTAASTGRKEIRIAGRGSPAGGVFPLVEVWLDSTLVRTLTVSATTFSTYVVTTTVTAGPHTLKLEFTNDDLINGEDRNVHLDAATLVNANAFPTVKNVPSPATNSYVVAKPQLRATYSDPDGDSGYVDYEVRTDPAGTLVAGGRSPATEHGAVASWTVPNALTDGQRYRWRARAYDGTNYAAAWYANQYFTVDAVTPAAPTVSSTAYPAGSWSGSNGQAGTFTFGPGGSTDVVGYTYGLDRPPLTATTSATVTLNPVEGPHRLFVQSVDRAGNVSAPTEYAFNTGAGAVTSPGEGDSTSKRFTLRAVASSAYTSLVYQWRRSDVDSWADVPAANVTFSNGGAVTWPLAVTSGTVPALTWDAAATTGGTDGPFEVRARLIGGAGATTTGTRVVLDQLDSSAAAAPIGAGAVNLLTGNLVLSATDLALDTLASDITIKRFHASRDPQAAATGPFGPGWTSTIGVRGAVSQYTRLTASGTLRTAHLADGTGIGFTATSATAFAPQPGAEGLSLTQTAGAATTSDGTDDVYVVSDDLGNTTEFTWQSTGLLPTKVVEGASDAITTFAYETVAGVTRVARAVAPVPTGVSCTVLTTRGCRSLSFDYAPSTTPVPGSAGGDYANRLRSVSMTAWDPATSAARTVEIARWSYLPSGRLLSAWDPRLPALKTTYAYDAAGHVTSITAGAEEPYTFAYATVPGDANGGRLRSVSRSALTAGTATQTFVYRVPLSGTGAPADLSAAQLARWGQTDVPTDATAIFPANQLPGDDPVNGVLPASYERATVTYLDVTGREVNVLAPGGGLVTNEFDTFGNLVRSLSAANRARALGASATDTPEQESALAARLSTSRVYSADGAMLLETYGPEHEVALAAGVTDSLGRVWPAGALVRARAHTVNTYDEGAPAGTGPYGLVTTLRSGARIADTTTDTDVRTTAMAYDWTLRAPTVVTIDPGGLNLVSRTSYDAATGLPLRSTTPGGTAAQDDAYTLVNTYYTVGANTTYPECGGRREWQHLLCRTDPAAQPAVTADRPAIPSKVFEYDMFNAATKTTEKVGATVVRTWTTQFDAAHRPWRTSVTATTGTALPTVEAYYDPVTGRQTETRAIDGAGAVTAKVSRVFDSLGRLTSYTDADGNTSTTTYDLMSRPVTTSDGKGTQTHHYDDGTERRGLLTRVVDSAAGTFSATYDVEGGVVTHDYPNGLRATTTRDEAGTPVRLDYTKGSSTWLSFTAAPSIHGEVLAASSSGLSSQQYGYDASGRLVDVRDTVAGGGCTVRTYTLDAESRRTALVTRRPDAEGGCDPAGAASTISYAHDAAARLTTAGYAYDALGRTTSVPAGDAGGKPLTATYYVNDLVRSLAPQDGTTRTWTLDVTQDRFRSWTDNGVTKVHHYAGDGDAPAWTAEGGTAWSRNIGGAAGGLAAVQDSVAGVSLRLVNLHGDVVATASTDPTATGPTATFEATEFGAPRDGAVRRYGWLGGHERQADGPAGIVLMGVRLYNPATGRFLQPDPVTGGSSNAYDYANHDPVNGRDLDGRRTYDLYYSLGWFWTTGNKVFGNLRWSFGSVFPVTGRAATLSHVGQQMNLWVGPLWFPVTVAEIWSNGWRFSTRIGHPDYPGWVSFRINTGSNGYLTLHVHANVPSYAALFAPAAACGLNYWHCTNDIWDLYVAGARKNWQNFANNIKSFMWSKMPMPQNYYLP